MHGDITWIDLSALEFNKARAFYCAVMGWEFKDDGGGYLNAFRDRQVCAGLYETPDFFKKIGMPSFWMSYIAVDDVEAVVQRAGALGGKVELEETTPVGRVALIRDPLGAGFTCYEGKAASTQVDGPQPGRWYWNELFISNLSQVDAFYTELFGWEIKGEGQDRHGIFNQGRRIGSIQVASNDLKGDKEFWAVYFGVEDLSAARRNIEKAGGEVIFEHRNADGEHLLVCDNQGGAFFISASGGGTGQNLAAGSSMKWRSLLGLIMIYWAVVQEAQWIWGLLFLVWVLPDLKSGTTYFIEPLSRRQNPWLYWAVVVTWLWMAAYFFFI